MSDARSPDDIVRRNRARGEVEEEPVRRRVAPEQQESVGDGDTRQVVEVLVQADSGIRA